MNKREVFLLIMFFVLSTLAAVFEGIGIGLFAQILDTQTSGDLFASIPLLGSFSSYFEGQPLRDRIELVATVLIVVVIVRSLLQYAVLAIANILPIDLIRRKTTDAYDALQDSSLAFVHERDVGSVSADILIAMGKVSALIQQFAHVISSLILLMFYFMFLLMLSPGMTLLIMLGMVVGTIILKLLTEGIGKRAMEQMMFEDERRMRVLTDEIGGARLIRLINAQGYMARRWNDASRAFANAYMKHSLVTALPSPFMMGYVGLMGGGAIWFMLAYNSAEPTTWLSSVLLFLAILLRMQGPVSVFNAALNYVVAVSPALTQFEGFVARAKAAKQFSGSVKIVSFERSVSFNHLNFSYEGSSIPILKDISFEIKKGDFLAIVGPSGAGKSTLVSLLCLLHRPEAASITVDGVPLADFDVKSWRKKISVVSQDIFLFNSSILDNIRFGLEASREEVIAAAKRVHAHEFIIGTENGYDTKIGDRGVRLSGGQQQRIALARAVLANSEILVLDEATSQLDSFTENAIQQTIFELAEDRTIIAIAHRLSTIKHADLVVVLQDGKLVETGTHNQLMKLDGIYSEMRKIQEFGD
ncbi:ABC transporter ATP-binding protein [Terasakiella pusilla]|uniref:ABC transporter ATP-binding protein n=1 Tax=Terasakiella pusilla TaxID=64973 RepID=UPI003AA7DE6A